MNFYLELLEIYKNDNFSWGHFAWTTWWTWHYVSNLLLFYLQKMSLSKTKSELLLPVHQLCIRIRKKWKIWIFEIHYASYILNSKVKFKNHIFQYCLILLQNWYFLAKTEWEKCPISDILDKLTKLFQIRQVCASLCDNKPYPNFASKVVFYDAYHQYKLCF